jgi:hypothetical protein
VRAAGAILGYAKGVVQGAGLVVGSSFLGPCFWVFCFLLLAFLLLTLRVLGALGSLGLKAAYRPPPWLVCELWLGVSRVFRERVYMVGG